MSQKSIIKFRTGYFRLVDNNKKDVFDFVEFLAKNSIMLFLNHPHEFGKYCVSNIVVHQFPCESFWVYFGEKQVDTIFKMPKPSINKKYQQCSSYKKCWGGEGIQRWKHWTNCEWCTGHSLRVTLPNRMNFRKSYKGSFSIQKFILQILDLHTGL